MSMSMNMASDTGSEDESDNYLEDEREPDKATTLGNVRTIMATVIGNKGKGRAPLAADDEDYSSSSWLSTDDEDKTDYDNDAAIYECELSNRINEVAQTFRDAEDSSSSESMDTSIHELVCHKRSNMYSNGDDTDSELGHQCSKRKKRADDDTDSDDNQENLNATEESSN